jgi:hypothetical protein
MRTKLDIEICVTVNAHEIFWNELEGLLKSGKWDGRHGMPVYLLHKIYREYRENLYHFDTFEKWYKAIKEIGAPWNYPHDNVWKRPFQFIPWLDRGKRVYRYISELYSAKEPRPKKYRYGSWLYRHELKSRWAKAFEPSPEKRAEAKEAREKKRLWRETLGKHKDQSNSWHRNPGRFYKRLRATQHRAFVKKMLLNEKYEAFSNKEYVNFVDRWTWD